MVYFCAYACSEIFQKNARELILGVGHVQFYAGINGLKKEKNQKPKKTLQFQIFTESTLLVHKECEV